MAKLTEYSNVKVTINDQNDSFIPNKNVRSVTARYSPEENTFILTTPAPQIKSDPVPPLYEVKTMGMKLNKFSKGYKVTWDVNVQASKVAGIKKVKSHLCDCVDAMFKEIETNNL